MEIKSKLDQDNKVVLITLQGRLDVDGAQAVEPDFRQQIAQAGHAVVLDVAGLEFMGSMGIRLLLSGAKALKQRGLAMVILNPAAAVEDVWYSAGLADVVPVAHSYADAFALCASAS